MKKLIAISALLFLFVSCKKILPGCFTPTGEMKVKTVAAGDFRVLEIENYFDLTLVQDSQNYVLFKCGENLLPEIKAENNNGLLSLTDNNKCRWMRNYEAEKPVAEVHFSHLDSIVVLRECDIRSEGKVKGEVFLINFRESHLATLNIDIDVTNFYLKVNPSSGDYFVRGRCWNNYIYSIGYSYIHTEDLWCANSYVYSYSTGDIYVKPEDILEVHIYNYGNVFCCSKPGNVKIDRPDYAHGNLIYSVCSDTL